MSFILCTSSKKRYDQQTQHLHAPKLNGSAALTRKEKMKIGRAQLFRSKYSEQHYFWPLKNQISISTSFKASFLSISNGQNAKLNLRPKNLKKIVELPEACSKHTKIKKKTQLATRILARLHWSPGIRKLFLLLEEKTPEKMKNPKQLNYQTIFSPPQ